MRIARMELLRYGHFSERRVELPAGSPDMHIILGRNEAGKSSACCAIEDVLFGVPQVSPMGYLFGYDAMRLGAVLENHGGRLEFRRRKGRQRTVLSGDEGEAPLAEGEAALAPFLNGASREFFRRMFCLDHQRLNQGGRDILEARDEVGQMLFSAGAGIGGLRDVLARMEDEADKLWAPRRAGHRRYYQAADRLKTAERELGEARVPASRWQSLKRERDAAARAYGEIEAEHEERSKAQQRLARVRRVYDDVQDKHRIEAELSGIGDVPDLPADARERLEAAERARREAETRVETLAARVADTRKEHDALELDDGLLQRADAVERLYREYVGVERARADLPKRRAELDGLEERVRDLAREVDWPAGSAEEVAARLPARPRLEAVETILQRRGEIAGAVDAAAAACVELDETIANLRRQLEETPSPPPAEPLAAAERHARESVDEAERRTVASEIGRLRTEIGHGLSGLRPPVSDLETLRAMPVPLRGEVQDLRDRWRDLAARMEREARALQEAREVLRQRQAKRDRLSAGSEVVTAEALASARAERDRLWEVVREVYGLPGATPAAARHEALDGGQLPEAYARAVAQADILADRRFDHAKAAAELAAADEAVAEQEEHVAGLERAGEALAEERATLQEAWAGLWRDAPFAPEPPEAMLEWLDRRAGLLDQGRDLAAAEEKMARLDKAARAARERMLHELAQLDVAGDTLAGAPLALVLERARDVREALEERRRERARIAEAVEDREAAVEAKRKALNKAEEDRKTWESEWRAAVERVGLDPAADPEVVRRQLGILREIAATSAKAQDLRQDRIATMERDIARFAENAVELARAVAPELCGEDPDDVALSLNARLQEMRQCAQRKATLTETLAKQETDLREARDAARASEREIGALRDLAGAEDDAGLMAAIARAERRRALRTEHDRIVARLHGQGDGLTIAELEDACADHDPDTAEARDVALRAELEALRTRLTDAAAARAETEAAFAQVGGDARAAEAEARRHEALAEMREAAEQWARVRSAGLVLRWAIERYRDEKQGPLVRRAGAYFASLTLESFTGLRVDHDDNDRPYLVGLRADGARVPVEGMSSGSVDQLYLALRVAAVMDYLERASALPFVADDLFVNFDDDRAAAGLKLLHELATRTQVIFFTHHRHLCEVAAQALTPGVPVIELGEEKVRRKSA